MTVNRKLVVLRPQLPLDHASKYKGTIWFGKHTHKFLKICILVTRNLMEAIYFRSRDWPFPWILTGHLLRIENLGLSVPPKTAKLSIMLAEMRWTTTTWKRLPSKNKPKKKKFHILMKLLLVNVQRRETMISFFWNGYWWGLSVKWMYAIFGTFYPWKYLSLFPFLHPRGLNSWAFYFHAVHTAGWQ